MRDSEQRKRDSRPRPPGGSSIEHYGTAVERRKKAADAAAKRQRDAALVEQVRALLEYDEQRGLFKDLAEGTAFQVANLNAIRWVEDAQERLLLLCDDQGLPVEPSDSLLLEYILCALRMADREEGQRWNDIAHTWLEKLGAGEMKVATKRYLMKFLSSFHKAMRELDQLKPPKKTARNRVITEMVELVVQYSGLIHRRQGTTYLTAERERTRDESGCSIVQQALAKLGVNMKEDAVRDIFDNFEADYAAPLRKWLSKHRKNLTLPEAYEKYHPRPTLVPESLVKGLTDKQRDARIRELHPFARLICIVPVSELEAPSPALSAATTVLRGHDS
jgi:hypothetical protein